MSQRFCRKVAYREQQLPGGDTDGSEDGNSEARSSSGKGGLKPDGEDKGSKISRIIRLKAISEDDTYS